MPFKYVSKAVFITSALVCGVMYILLSKVFKPVEGACYRTQQLLILIYLLYLLLITPFNTEYFFARVRSADYTDYTLIFLLNLTGISVAYWGAVTAEVWLLGSFVVHDNMSFNTAISPMIHLLANLMFLNFFHTVLCRWLRNSSARKVIIFSVPLIQMAAHYFGSDELRRFVFMCYGTFEQPLPYIIGVYTVVFAILIFLSLKKTRREYV